METPDYVAPDDGTSTSNFMEFGRAIQQMDPDQESPFGGVPHNAPEAPEPEESKPYRVDGVDYYDEPSLANQYEAYPETCRLTPAKFAMFDLLKAGDVDRMNLLYARQEPPGAPDVMVIEKDDHKADGGWYTRISYYKVLYKKLIEN